MPQPLLQMVKGSKRSVEGKTWPTWLRAAAKIASQWGNLDDDPFAYNEAASVSLLTAAAVKANLFALAEFVVTKRHKMDRRRNVSGRCDLWICSETTSWAFECKQQFYEGATHKPSTIAGWLNQAHSDATAVAHDEGDKRFGLLIISTYFAESIEPDFTEAITEVCNNADYAWRLTSPSESVGDTYLVFKEVKRNKRVS